MLGNKHFVTLKDTNWQVNPAFFYNQWPLCQLVKVSTILPTDPDSVYIKRVKGVHPMQLTSKRHSMVVEFRPHAILTDKFVYTLKFKGDTQSMRLFNKKEMIEACNSRLDIHGYQVTDFLTEPQQYMPACC